MSLSNINVCLILGVVTILTAVITVSINVSGILKLFDNEKITDEPEHGSMHIAPWKDTDTPNVVRKRQAYHMLSFIDNSVDPCNDFYQYACGNWEKQNPIPKDEWQYYPIHILQNNLDKKFREILLEPIETPTRQSAISKAKAYFRSCIDYDADGKESVASLRKYIEVLGGWPALDGDWNEKDFDWLDLSSQLSFIGDGVVISYGMEKNPTTPNEYSIFLKQTSLGMTNRDNYLKQENSKSLFFYGKLIIKVLQLFNVSKKEAQQVSKEIINFEVRLANATLSPEALKTHRYYQPNLGQLKKAYPYINWTKYFSKAINNTINKNQTFLMQLGVKYYRYLYQVLANTENKIISNYMIWRLVLYVLPSMGKSFRQVWNDFNAAVTGQEVGSALWKICVGQINLNMGMAMAAMFVRKHFDEVSKLQTIDIISSIKEAFRENLDELHWLDEETKGYAWEKAKSMKIAVGYPDFILSDDKLNELYRTIEIVNGNNFENGLSISKNRQQQKNLRLYKSFKKDNWILPPTIANAQYDISTNQIFVLAGLLQAPVFHKDFPEYLNYGAIGVFMGHELIHGFDDNGRRYDLEGNYNNWWKNKSVSEFIEKKMCFIEQYANFSNDKNTLNSFLTISEDLSDNGGIRLAYKAYLKAKKTYNRDSNMGFKDFNLTDDKLFFLSFAQLFCETTRPEAAIEAQGYSGHSPRKYRVLGTLMNFEKFSKVFKCPLGSPMNPSNKCRLW